MAGMERYPRYSYERENILDPPIQSRYGSGEVLRYLEGGSQEIFSPKTFEDATQEDDGESSVTLVIDFCTIMHFHLG
jgi:hypothetical protein